MASSTRPHLLSAVPRLLWPETTWGRFQRLSGNSRSLHWPVRSFVRPGPARCTTTLRRPTSSESYENARRPTGLTAGQQQCPEPVMKLPIVRRFLQRLFVDGTSRRQGPGRERKPAEFFRPLLDRSLAGGMVKLAGEGRPRGHLLHVLGHLAFVPRGQRQQLRTSILREDRLLRRGSGQLRQHFADSLQHAPRQQIVSVEREMDVFIEQVAAENAANGQVALGQRLFRVRQMDAGDVLLGRHFADDRVDAGIGAEPQSIQVASGNILAACLRRAVQRRETSPQSEAEFRKTVVDPRRRLVLGSCFQPLFIRFPFRRRPGRATPISPTPPPTNRIGAARPAAGSL